MKNNFTGVFSNEKKTIMTANQEQNRYQFKDRFRFLKHPCEILENTPSKLQTNCRHQSKSFAIPSQFLLTIAMTLTEGKGILA